VLMAVRPPTQGAQQPVPGRLSKTSFIGGVVFEPSSPAYNYWFTKVFGFRLDERGAGRRYGAGWWAAI